MKIIQKNTSTNYQFTIIPRFWDYDLSITIRNAYTNIELTLGLTPIDFNGQLIINLGTFIPVEDEKYETTLKTTNGEVVWFGKIMYTLKDVQNYTPSATKENNLKF